MTSIKSEVSGRYSRSRLGGAWIIIHPLAQVLVMALVLSQLLGAKLTGIDSQYAYAVYLLSGTLAWNVFAETVTTTLPMFSDRANLLKKINFPRVCIPIIVAATCLLNHLILMVITILIVWALGVAPTKVLTVLPLLVLINLGLAMGIGLILSVFDVFIRDVGHFWQVVVHFWFWLTPIVYVADVLPQSLQGLINYNPMYWITHSYQQVIVYGNWPDWSPLLVIALIASLLLTFGFVLFMRARSDIVDAL